MAFDPTWFDRTLLRGRVPEFGEIRYYDDGAVRPIVVMVFDPLRPEQSSVIVTDGEPSLAGMLEPDPTPDPTPIPQSTSDSELELWRSWTRTRECWLELPPHPNILDAIAPCSGRPARSYPVRRVRSVLRLALEESCGPNEIARRLDFPNVATRDILRAARIAGLVRWSDVTALDDDELEAAAAPPSPAVILRYAAIDWGFADPLPDSSDVRVHHRVATWGLQLTSVAEMIAKNVAPDDRPWLSNPLVVLDLDWQVRVGFLPPSTPDLDEPWDRECSLVRRVGESLAVLWTCGPRAASCPIGKVIAKCVRTTPRDRFRSLDKLRDALVDAGATDGTVREGHRLDVWNLVERAIAHLALGDKETALEYFNDALGIDPTCSIALAGRTRAIAEIGRPSRSSRSVSKPSPRFESNDLTWPVAVDLAAPHEASRAFDKALAIYRRVRSDQRDGNADFSARIAHCFAEVGEWDHAIRTARDALATEPARADATSTLVRALLAKKDIVEAMTIADRCCAHDPQNARAHYLRGRCQFALRRLEEARDSFDRACSLEPALVEAMLLRREVDRSLGHVRETVGSQPAVLAIVPDHLADLRAMLATGRVRDAIARLRQPVYGDDAAAQLVLAGCLHHTRDLYNAVSVYLRIEDTFPEHRRDAMIGRARVMIDLGRPDEAIALVELASANIGDNQTG